MRFVPGQRTAVLSVGEFATFRLGPVEFAGGRTGAWRTAIGSAWHQTLRDRLGSTTPSAKFEVPIQGRLLHGRWSIELQGRLDQVEPQAHGLILREIKTVSGALPRPPEDLIRDYPEYFRQLAAYRRLADLDPNFITLAGGQPVLAELVFVDYVSGIVQTVPLSDSDAHAWLENQLHTLHPYLEHRWSATQRIAALPVRSAFLELRPGQAEARAMLADAMGQAGVVFFEAPTGFGKTGLLLEYALARMREGHCQRLLYLTGKGTGQAPVTAQLRSLLGEEPELSHLQLRSRREHAIETPLHTCDARGACKEGLEARWEQAGLDPMALFEAGTLPLEKSRQLGAQTGVCPYEITRAALPFAEVWICDYNYVFSPAHRGVLFNQPGFEPALSLLVLDEAHNLPARAADARSHAFLAGDAHAALFQLQETHARPPFIRAAGQIADFLTPLRPSPRLDLTTLYAWTDLLESLATELRLAPLPEALPLEAADFLWKTSDALASLHDESLQMLPWVPAPGELRLSCLDAAPAIASALHEFGQSVLTSATFGPPELFLPACGLNSAETRWLTATAPWREGAYDIAVDARVDTRLRSRERHFATTAATVRSLADGQPRPVAVFFPSYDYAEKIRTYLEAMDSLTRVAMQPRGVDLAAQTEFLEEALLSAHAIFLVLGGSFAEGVDRLGGAVDRAMVVGPSLSEPNPVNEARRAHYESTFGPDEAFRRTYLAPGLLKVAQAIGRLVRAPGQHAKVLLHCRRFAEPGMQALLPPEYRGGPVLRDEPAILQWLNS